MASTSADIEGATEVTMPVTSDGAMILTSSVLGKAHSCPEDAVDAVESMGAAFDIIYQAFPHAEVAAATSKLRMAYGSLFEGNLELQNTARNCFAALSQLFFHVEVSPGMIKGPNQACSIGTRPEYFQSRMEMMAAQFQDLHSMFFELSHLLCERCSPVEAGPSSQEQSKPYHLASIAASWKRSLAGKMKQKHKIEVSLPSQSAKLGYNVCLEFWLILTYQDLSHEDDLGVKGSRSGPVPAAAD
ncbi:hypothetical protein BKA93DRAFT_750156 [Sparassis latifolia]